MTVELKGWARSRGLRPAAGEGAAALLLASSAGECCSSAGARSLLEESSSLSFENTTRVDIVAVAVLVCCEVSGALS